ncbi:NADP-dependent phosphogluconate dehydrogenase [Aliarcobacter cryaerophilus]|uniref:6-phosphogluconate dehydrogenase, decarboxylating n=1 Tax=Aliarcobacter cryaerophilus TaxID=28198 RepID=A0AA46MZX8_9BACT|nr:NADP-dependent phosphogluconate dehydrogenase [Aliarcobacter cryaerophilus]UYF42481.1 NADP-dependent phosphogluconate dehydrogenase [Aliarcobacter cryaerophilus]
MNDIGIWGLGVMGQNLALNFASKGYSISVYNRTEDGEDNIVSDFMDKVDSDYSIEGFTSISEFVSSLKKDKIVLIMVKAGTILDSVIEVIVPLLSKNDIIIDGGNSDYMDTLRRLEYLSEKDIDYIGCGISGGSEGALKGPSMMPGGSFQAWDKISSMFRDISAKDKYGNPCCEWIGKDGAGHFVKTVHNGIEYAVMQIIAEVYDIQKKLLCFDNVTISDNFKNWQTDELKNYLFEITSNLLILKDKDSNYILDSILDKSSQKGTGKNTVIASFDYNIPTPLISEAVNARLISGFYSNRTQLNQFYKMGKISEINKKEVEESLYDGIYLAILFSYLNGLELIRESSLKNNWNIDLGNIIKVWKAGCIIQSDILYFLEDVVLDSNNSESLYLNQKIAKEVNARESSLRKLVVNAILSGTPVSVLSSAVSFIDSLKSLQLPANLIQIQRDFFGYHGYEKINRDGQIYHLDGEV